MGIMGLHNFDVSIVLCEMISKSVFRIIKYIFKTLTLVTTKCLHTINMTYTKKINKG